ncbi:MAG: hypothetical protein NC343_06590 [Muribaculum sp.]|nr:hypothetical protein [Muribaculaceae bacterium]MCM1081402.1 hypothetical protein [Muribaculum sp.]
MIAKKVILLTGLMLGSICSAMAQSYYDDDIYYNPDKDTKSKQINAAVQKNRQLRQQQETAQQQRLQQQAYQQLYQQYYGNYNPDLGGGDFAAAGTYTPETKGTSRDVDEYNRRGTTPTVEKTDSIPLSALTQPEEFAYTQRIEKYYNPDIIASTNDPDLVNYYYSSASSQPDINIYVSSPGWGGYYSPWAWSYWDPYWYGPSWGWNWGWGPSWSMSWGWGGSSWSWGWNWNWNWSPAWAWGGPGWGWSGPGWSHGWAWSRPGSYTPNGRRPTGIRNGYTGIGNNRPITTSRFDQNYNSVRNNRYNLTPGQVGSYRPGQSQQGSRVPSATQGATTTRPTGNYGTTSGNRNGNSSQNRSYQSQQPTQSRWGSQSGGSYRSSGGFGGSSGGGGSHRGGRR